MTQAMTKSRLTPGTYLRMRREAACLSLRDTAARFAGPRHYAEAAERMLAGVEIDIRLLDAADLARLRLIFPFDADIYAKLVADVPTPPVCTGCACSWHDPCRGAAGPCAWADPDATICTRCASTPAQGTPA